MSISPTLRDTGTGVISERRACQRRSVMDRRLVTVNLDNKDAGLLVDISELGMAIQALARIKAGATTALQFELPDTATRIETAGTVAWADSTSGRAGIRFQGLSEASRTCLREWLELKPSQDSPTASAPLAPPPSVLLGPESKVAEVAALQREITNRGLDRGAALELIAERACALTSAAGAAIVVGDAKLMTCTASCGSAPPIGSDLRPDSGLSGECVRTGVTVRCEDTELDARVDREACRALNVRSAVIVPLFSRGNINGLVEIFYAIPRGFEGRDVLTLRRIADLISATLCGPVVREPNPAPFHPPVPAPMIPPPPRVTSVQGRVVCDVCGHENPSGINDCEKCDVPLPGRWSRKKEASAGAVGGNVQEETQSALLPAANTPRQRPRRVTTPTPVVITTVLLVLLVALWAWQRFKWRTASAAPPASPVSAVELPPPTLVSSSAAATISESFIPVSIPPSSSVPAAKTATPSKESKARAPLQPVKEVMSSTSMQASSQTRSLPAPAPEDVVPPPIVESAGAPMTVSLLSPPTMSPKLSVPAAATLSPSVVVRRVEPVYPKMAISLHVQGTVVLRATVLRNGRLSMIHVISGNDLLVPAALHAVQQWRYKPAELDGKPVETDATIKVSFALAR